MIFPQCSVNFQNSESTRHFGSSPSLQEIKSECIPWRQVGKRFLHKESNQRRKTSSRICPIAMLQRIAIFCWLILSDFYLWTWNYRDFKTRNSNKLQLIAQASQKREQLASPADVTNAWGSSSPFTRPWIETSQLQAFTDSWGFDGFI